MEKRARNRVDSLPGGNGTIYPVTYGGSWRWNERRKQPFLWAIKQYRKIHPVELPPTSRDSIYDVILCGEPFREPVIVEECHCWRISGPSASINLRSIWADQLQHAWEQLTRIICINFFPLFLFLAFRHSVLHERSPDYNESIVAAISPLLRPIDWFPL